MRPECSIAAQRLKEENERAHLLSVELRANEQVMIDPTARYRWHFQSRSD